MKLSLWKQLAIFVVLAIGVGVGVFFLMRNVVFGGEGEMDKVISSTITSMGVITVGGASVIQLRKHILFEQQANSELLYKAIEHLKSEELYIRLGALDELRRLINKQSAENICEILSAFMREHIENEKYQSLSTELEQRVIQQDVQLAGHILSKIFLAYCHRAQLEYLQAQKISALNLSLIGANLKGANFDGSYLQHANFHGANLCHVSFVLADLTQAMLCEAKGNKGAFSEQPTELCWANFSGATLEGADLRGANLRGATNLTVEQLRDAMTDPIKHKGWVSRTQLDPVLYVELELYKLKAERKKG